MNIYINTQAGFRGISVINKELNKHLDIKTVSYCCARQWVLRLGYGILNQKIEKRDDWIYIADFSIQLGKERCLLVLGVSYESVTKDGYDLKHHQVQVLDICVREHFDGQIVYQRLALTREKTGTPCQIISDNGNDIRKGIQLFCNKNKSVTHTYDVSHMIGICIKHQLENYHQ